MSDPLESLVAMLRSMHNIEVNVEREHQPVMAGSGTREDPFYEEGPARVWAPTGKVTITITGEFARTLLEEPHI